MNEKILICGVNWLGDCIMSMPAIQLYKKLYPDCKITMLIKPNLTDLWQMNNSIDGIIKLNENPFGTLQAVRSIKSQEFNKAFIFPNSFRSALIPFAGRVPYRIGTRGHQRAFMLTDIIEQRAEGYTKHQSLEYMDIMGITGYKKEEKSEIPLLSVPADIVNATISRLGENSNNWTGMIPGAAYGSSKRWPANYFIEVGKKLIENHDLRILVFGLNQEVDLCGKISEGIGPKSINMAGKTSFSELASFLRICRMVITNDNGGMHLAAAMGTKVVAIFGLTNPDITGPCGSGHKIIFKKGINKSRDLDRNSPEALEVLRLIKPERVYNAAVHILKS